MFFNRMGVAVFWGTTAVILFLLIWVFTACNLMPALPAQGGQPTPVSAIPTPAPESAISAALPAIEVHSTLPNAIREEAQRIWVKPDAVPEMMKGELLANESDTYVLWVQTGQTLTVNTAGSMEFTMRDKNGMFLDTETGTGVMAATLPANGDYYVTAEAPAENGRYSYTLLISISNTLPVPPTAQSQTVPQLETILIIEENTSTTIPGTLQNGNPNLYQIPAETGESLAVFLNAIPSDIQVILTGQDKIELGHTTTGIPLTRQLPTSQDYLLQVYLMAGEAEVDYLLTIARMESGSPPTPAAQEALSFAPGTTSTSVNGTVDKNTNQTYPYKFTTGQRLIIDVVPANSGITISVRGADGVKLGWTPAGIQFSAVIPVTQTYFIDLVAPGNTNEPLDYGMTVTIQ